MKAIENRSFFLITAKQPLVDWVNAQGDDPMPPEYILGNPNLYAVQQITYTTKENIEALLKKHFKKIFVEELSSWYENPAIFPKPLTFDLFKKWFDYQYIELCFDLCRGEIRRENFNIDKTPAG